MTVSLPVRIDFIGGWSDQLDWVGPGAVVNAAIGWDDEYPLTYDANGFTSAVEGIGTGLGISSIREAGKFIYGQSGVKQGYIEHVLTAEAQEGTKGGWQDQVGAVEPGFKLIVTPDHTQFDIRQNDGHPIMEHVILYDTGIRRPSRVIGDKVRHLMATSPDFRAMLKQNVADAFVMFAADDVRYGSVRYSVELITDAWRRFAAFVPEIEVPFPLSHAAVWGHKLLGAGGGGFGLCFCDWGTRGEVLTAFRDNGVWARIPQLLPGVRVD